MLLVTVLASLLLPAVLLGLLWWRIKRSHLLRLAARLPGPKTELLLGNAREFGNSPREIFLTLVRLWKENGQLIRIWVGPFLFVILNDPKDVEVVMASTKHIDKAINYDFMKPWLGTGLLTSTGKKWHKNRKIITPTFHFKILEQFVDAFNTNVDIMIHKLKKELNGPSFDIYNYITLCALDIICETAMGVGVNAQDEKDSEYARALREEVDIIMLRTVKPWFYSNFLLNLTGYGKRQTEALAVLHNMTNELICKRKQQLIHAQSNTSNGHVNHEEHGGVGQKKRLAFLDLLLQMAHNGADLSDENIREEVDTFMFEGHDTTTSGVCFTLWFLSKHQDVQEKVVQGLEGMFSSTGELVPSLQDLNDMKYLERVIKESLRLCPSVPAMGRHIKEDLPINTGGLVLPASTSIMILPYLLHRNPDYFPEPDKFDPDRFLPDSVQGRHPYVYIPFSAGPRNCIGQKFAMLEMKTMVSKILWHYHLIADPSFEPEFTMELVLKSDNGVKIQLAPRNRLQS